MTEDGIIVVFGHAFLAEWVLLITGLVFGATVGFCFGYCRGMKAAVGEEIT